MKIIILLLLGLNAVSTINDCKNIVKRNKKKEKLQKKKISTLGLSIAVISIIVGVALTVWGAARLGTRLGVMQVHKKTRSNLAKKIIETNPNLPSDIQNIIRNGFERMPTFGDHELNYKATDQGAADIKLKLWKKGYVMFRPGANDKIMVASKSKLVKALNELADKQKDPKVVEYMRNRAKYLEKVTSIGGMYQWIDDAREKGILQT